jgi:hypothetical protein
MNRRKFFGMMAAAPAAAKGAADMAVAELSRINVGAGALGQLGGGSYGMPVGSYPTSAGQQRLFDPRELMRKALADPKQRAAMASLLFEKHRTVGVIDPDIACYRSFSLNAKVAFQRQRNVERDLDEECSAPWYEGFGSIRDKIFGFLQ